MTSARRVPVIHGWRWIAEAFALFRRNPLIWLVLTGVLFGIAMALSLVPVLGTYLLYLLTPLLLAGLMTACRDAEAGKEIEIAHLVRGFRENASQLVTIGGVYLVGNVVIGGIVMSVGGAELQEAFRAAREGTPEALSAEVANRASVALLIGGALFVPLAMATWFAPALVILDNLPALPALQLSMRGCLANLLPFLLYGMIMSGLLFAAMLLLFVGVLFWLPLALLTGYTGYRDVFHGESTGVEQRLP